MGRRDAQQSTNTAHKMGDMLITDLSDMLSNVKLMLKLTHKFSVMVDSTTDSDMLDFMVDMPTMLPPSPSPSPPLSPRPSRLPALRSLPNIALCPNRQRGRHPRRDLPRCHQGRLHTCRPLHPQDHLRGRSYRNRRAPRCRRIRSPWSFLGIKISNQSQELQSR